MSAYDLAAAVTFALFLAACLAGVRWADRPAPGSRWDCTRHGDADTTAAEHGPELSAPDVLDGAPRTYEH